MKFLQFFANVTAAEKVFVSIYEKRVGFRKSVHNFIEISLRRSLLALEFENANF